MPSPKSHSEIARAEKAGKLKVKLKTSLDRTAEQYELTMSDQLKAAIIDEVLHQTDSPNRAGRIIDHLLSSQEKLPSLHDAQLRQERIAYAAELVREPEPDFRIKADSRSSRILTNEGGGSRGL
jgi:hypothetical protein